jgi:hypothetical protein
MSKPRNNSVAKASTSKKKTHKNKTKQEKLNKTLFLGAAFVLEVKLQHRVVELGVWVDQAWFLGFRVGESRFSMRFRLRG